MTNSYIPLAIYFFDFLADGLKWHKKGSKRVLLCLVVFGVPMWIALVYPDIFLVALGYAGGFSCAFLFGLMPPLMVWIGRYVKRLPLERGRLPGGKPLLAFLMIFALLILGAEVVQQLLPSL
jgi:tyrosine-specific transport protein